MKSSLLAALAAAGATVSAHGNITFPAARLPGPAMLAVCGQAAVDTVLGDGTIALEEVKPSSPACNIGLCRGAQFADNAANVQAYSPGQVVLIEVALTIPHLGPANLSIVDTATNAMIGDILLFFDVYADEAAPELPANNTAFGVTMPTGSKGAEVAARCATPGSCVLQWWWLGTDAKQTYESCVDFVMVGGDAAAGAVGKEGKAVDVNADLKMAQEARNRMLVVQGGNAGGSGPAVTGGNVDGVDVGTETAVTAPDGSFGGVQGSVDAADAEAGVAVADSGVAVAAPEGSFGGVQGLAPIPARSRIMRGRV